MKESKKTKKSSTSCLYQGYSIEGDRPMLVVREQFGTARIYDIEAKSILSRATGFISAYDFTLNPYRGCQYGCSYCYAAAFSPNQKMRQDWGNWVLIKRNAVDQLRKELDRWYKKNSRPPSLYISSVTDPYQPIESKSQITRGCLEVLLEYDPQPIVTLQTRSPIITRDLDLLCRFHQLRINFSIPTGSEAVRRDFEPRSPSLQARFNALNKFRYGIAAQTENYSFKLSVTLTPLLPTQPQDWLSLIRKLAVADRVVIQPFHSSSGKRSLVATTRDEAVALKQKYDWWYANEALSYSLFHDFLKARLPLSNPDLELQEGRSGFSYD